METVTVPDIGKFSREEILEKARHFGLQMDIRQNTEKLRTRLGITIFDKIADGLAIRDIKYILDQSGLTEKRNERKKGLLRMHYLSEPSSHHYILELMVDRYNENAERKNRHKENQASASKRIHEIRFANPGIENKCYANSITSVVINIKPLKNLLFDQNIVGKIKEGRGGLVRELTTLMSLPNYSVASTTGLQKIVTEICRQEFPNSAKDFTKSNQCDSSEFLVSLMDCLKLEFKESEREEFERIFEGFIQQTETCNGCGYKTTRYEPFMVSSFPFSATLTDCINKYFRPDQIIEKRCQGCPGKQCMRTEIVTKFPAVLLIELLRYRFNPQTGVNMPIDRPVQIPQLLTFFGKKYGLHSFVTHAGMDIGGHYTAKVYDERNGTFTKFNDMQIVQDINVGQCKSEWGYVYVFSRCQSAVSFQSQEASLLDCDTFLQSSTCHQKVEEDDILSLSAPNVHMSKIRLPVDSVVDNSDTEQQSQVNVSLVSDKEDLSLPTPPYVQIMGMTLPVDRSTMDSSVSDKEDLPTPQYDQMTGMILPDGKGINRPDTMHSRTFNESAVSDYEELSLPTPPYVGMKNNNTNSPVNKKLRVDCRNSAIIQRDCLSNIVPEQIQLDSQPVSIQFEKMPRYQLLEYCRKNNLQPQNYVHHTRQRLLNTVIKHLLESLTKNISGLSLDNLLKQHGVMPANALKRKAGQIKSLYNKNRELQAEILKSLMSDNANRSISAALAETVVNVPVARDNFFPSNLAEIDSNRSKLRHLRQKRIEDLNNGVFKLLSQVGVNPILEAGKSFHQELKNIQWGMCRVCLEQWPELEIGPRNGKCQRCASERLPTGIPQTFSLENDMYPGRQPECLKVLNSVETAAISLICPVISIYRLRYGATGMKGHSISFHQDIESIINVLPRTPEDLPFIVIKAPHQEIPLKANRFHILHALQFLKQNNPEYSDITIDEDRLNLYPRNSQTPVQNIRTLPDTMSACTGAQEDANAMGDNDREDDDGGDLIDNHAGLNDVQLVETVGPVGMPTETVNNQIREAILGSDRADTVPECIDWPRRNDQPVSEWEPGFFSRSFPNLFPFGTGDLTKARIGKNPQFLAYIRHLTRLPDCGFAADPRFILHVISIFRRHKALTLANVYAKNVCHEMTMTELKERVEQNDPSIMKSLLAFSAQIPGTKAYFSYESKKSVAMERWIRIWSEGKEMLNVFLTFSLADRHMEELHRLLPGSDQYLGKTVVKRLTDIPPGNDPSLFIDERTDFLLRTKALNENGHLVDWFAKKRFNLLVDKVLHDVMGIVDYIVRYEYQARKSLHWHMAARMLGLSMQDLVAACKKYDFDVKLSSEEEQEMSEQEINDYNKMMYRGAVTDHPPTEEFKSHVQSCRERVVDFTTMDLGLSAVHPQSDPKCWPAPEGINTERPVTNSLRVNLLDVLNYELDYEYLVNLVQLHGCRRTYCIIKVVGAVSGYVRCRFGYPMTLIGYRQKLMEMSDIWDELTRLDEYLKGAGFISCRPEVIRNHPRIVCHIPELLPVWRANIDMKLISSPKQLLRYILKYIMKPEPGSLAFNDIVRLLTAGSDDNTPVRKLFQKVLLKVVSEHDISKNECWKIISGFPYVEYSRPFRNINIAGSRRVNTGSAMETGEEPAFGKNHADIYWSREEDPNYQTLVEKFENGETSLVDHPANTSLYKFACAFTKDWKPSTELHVPKPVPNFPYIPLPTNKEFRSVYCETKLLLHKPGANSDNLLEHHATLEEAISEFVNNDTRCPKIIKEEFLESLKIDPEYIDNENDNVEDLVPSANTQPDNYDQDDWMIGIGRELRPTDINEPEPDMADIIEDGDMELEPDLTADWSADRVKLGLTDTDIEEAQDWITRIKVTAALSDEEEEQISTNSLNPEQYRVYREIMEVMESQEKSIQCLIDVSGGAGTGKSFMIRCIQQKAYELTSDWNVVKIAAPTGSAASQFQRSQTLHSLLKIPVKKGSGDLDDLSGNALATLQESFRTTKVLICDEKGMLGCGRMWQINARLKQARPEHADLPFGGISIILGKCQK